MAAAGRDGKTARRAGFSNAIPTGADASRQPAGRPAQTSAPQERCGRFASVAFSSNKRGAGVCSVARWMSRRFGAEGGSHV